MNKIKLLNTLIAIEHDLVSHGNCWEGECFTKEHGDALIELADSLRVLINELAIDLKPNFKEG